MRVRPRQVACLALALALLSLTPPAFAIITRLIPLREVLASEQFIFTVKVADLNPEKASMVLQVTEDLKAKVPFRKLAVSLTADGQGQREGDTSKLLKRLAPELSLVVFVSKRGKRYTAFPYTNGTWFQMIGQAGNDPAALHWSFTHCEPYLRRTFKGTTAELRQTILDGLSDKKKPPEPDPTEPPGLGPELKRDGALLLQPHAQGGHAARSASRAGALFAVIPTFVIIGPLALLAALFPVVLGGLALVLRRWAVFLSIASLDSTLYLAHGWFRGYFTGSWAANPAFLWTILALIGLVGIYWSGQRQKKLGQRKTPTWLSTEAAMLWALTFVCMGMAATSFPRSRQTERIPPVWTFEPKEKGAILSSPALEGHRLYVAAIQGAGFSTYGTVYCLDVESGEELWRFDDDGAMQQVFSSPCLAAGRLYIGEGLHENRGSKFYCLDAATGQKLWHFPTASHIESSACVADGRVYFGAGSDGLYCLDALTGAERWHFRDNIHIDANPKVLRKRLYAGSGVSRTQKDARVFCLDAESGRVVWQHPAKLPVWGSPCVWGSRVFFGLGNGRYDKSADRPAGALLCVDRETGKEVWCHDVDDAVLASPAADEDSIYFGSRDHFCYCIGQDNGQLRWKTDLGSALLARPMVRDNGIYLVSSAGKVCRLEARTGKPAWQFDIAHHAGSRATVFASPARDELHHLYVSAALEDSLGSRAVVYCLQEVRSP